MENNIFHIFGQIFEATTLYKKYFHEVDTATGQKIQKIFGISN